MSIFHTSAAGTKRDMEKTVSEQKTLVSPFSKRPKFVHLAMHHTFPSNSRTENVVGYFAGAVYDGDGMVRGRSVVGPRTTQALLVLTSDMFKKVTWTFQPLFSRPLQQTRKPNQPEQERSPFLCRCMRFGYMVRWR